MSQITIIGLGLIGISLGLALKKEERSYTIIGHDKENDAVARAKKSGAIDKSHWNLISACEEADLILLAIPAAGIRPTLEAIREDLKPGCLIMDTATIKVPVLEAAEVLPDSVHFVGSNPILTASSHLTADEASADLFQNISWALCPTTTTSADAIQVAANLVTALGAQPFFLDPAEHDGLMAVVDATPTVLSAAFMNTTANNPAWREIRRMAGGQFETVTYLPDFEPNDLSEAVLTNRIGVAYWIDMLMAELTAWKEDLEAGEDEAVTQRFSDAIDSRSQWLRMRERGDWDERERPEDAPSFWKRMFGIGARRKDES